MHATRVVYIGKESNKVEEVEQGLIHDLSEVVQTVESRDGPAPTFDWGTGSLVELAERTGLSTRYLRAVKNGYKQPSSEAQRRIQLALAADRSA